MSQIPSIKMFFEQPTTENVSPDLSLDNNKSSYFSDVLGETMYSYNTYEDNYSNTTNSKEAQKSLNFNQQTESDNKYDTVINDNHLPEPQVSNLYSKENNKELTLNTKSDKRNSSTVNDTAQKEQVTKTNEYLKTKNDTKKLEPQETNKSKVAIKSKNNLAQIKYTKAHSHHNIHPQAQAKDLVKAKVIEKIKKNEVELPKTNLKNKNKNVDTKANKNVDKTIHQTEIKVTKNKTQPITLKDVTENKEIIKIETITRKKSQREKQDSKNHNLEHINSNVNKSIKNINPIKTAKVTTNEKDKLAAVAIEKQEKIALTTENHIVTNINDKPNKKQLANIPKIQILKQKITKINPTLVESKHTIARKNITTSHSTIIEPSAELINDKTILNQQLNPQNIKQEPLERFSLNKFQFATSSRFGQAEWSKEINEKIFLMVKSNMKEVSIRLDPPEMGGLIIKVSLSNDNASVNFNAQHADVRHALQEQIDKLQYLFEKKGMNLTDASVGKEGFDKNQDQDEQTAAGSNNHNTDETKQIISNENSPLILESGKLDFYA